MRYDGSLTVKEIAGWIHRSEVFVRRALENGSLGIGAYNREGKNGSYYISPKLAWERLGYRRDEENTDSNSTPLHDECNRCKGCNEMLGNGILQDRHYSIGNMDNSISDSGRQERMVRQGDSHLA